MTLTGLAERRLYFDGSMVFTARELPQAEIPSYTYTATPFLDELIADPQALAREAAVHVFHRFRWESSEAVIRGIQAGMGKP